jgi:BirA family biotin operon repressor/biotin-[acetyl-CoA-carboxylase] ligase
MPALRALLTLLADGRFHSGEELGRALGVSRAAVWKSIQVLPLQGVTIDAVQGRGYRLREPLELLDPSAIAAAVDPALRRELGPVEVLFEVDSTNRRLMTQAAGAVQGSTCLAETQSAGRGRRGRPWLSPFGANLYLSMLWRFSEGPARLSGLSLAVGVACVRALARLGARGVQLKWPNDLLWDGRKLAGILLEVAGESNGPCHVVVGIGVNLRMPHGADIDQPWADLREIAPDVSRNVLGGALIEELARVMREFEIGGFEALRSEWLANDAFAGRPVTLHLPSGPISGVARGVDAGGHLLLETATGIQRFASGEVSLRAR